MVKVADWQTVSPWTVAQKVQGSPSSDGGIYRDSYQQATAIVAALNTGSATAYGRQPTGRRRPGRGRPALTCGQPAANAAGGGSAAWGGYQNGRIPGDRAVPGPFDAGPATRMRRRHRVRPAQHRLQGRHRAEHRHHRRLPLLRRAGPCRLEKGSLCANPGTSNHGWGKAVDIGGCCGINSGTGPAFDWLTTNAGRYGWNHPAWAQAGGSKPEPWHWEYGSIS